MKLILGLVLVSILLNSMGQLLFKSGMNQIGVFDFSPANLLHLIGKIATNTSLISGLFIYFLSTAIWFLVLSRAEISFVYPLISISYLFTALGGYFFLHEAVSLTRLLGILIIITGVVLVCRS